MKATKGSKTSSKSSGAPKATASGSSSQASRSAAPNKNTKEAFLKKLKLCMQTFDYKDETKDAKGKADRL